VVVLLAAAAIVTSGRLQGGKVVTKHAVIFGLALLVLSWVAAPLMAQESTEAEQEHRNAVELFIGGVTETDESATGLGVGLGYVRHLSTMWGLGVSAELSSTDVSRDWVVIIPVYLYPTGGLVLWTGPAIEGSKDMSEGGGDNERSTNLGVRFGTAWEFEVGERFTLSPEVNLDLIDGSVTWVYGLSFGVGL
jgi:hypothetical protein